ncbi:hypothetical protein CCMA1212_006584 [Trichoderma ghanense]|uniref:Uncharacterized protein n=1 Tax=Trichoderma ghanense TaxID=65468 RepID=A0ABY2H1X9_9HYPO
MFWPHQPPLQLSCALITRIQTLVHPRCTGPADTGIREYALTDGQNPNQGRRSKRVTRYGASGGRPLRATSSTSIKTRCNSADGAIFPCTLVMPALLNPACQALRVTCNGRRAESMGASSNMAGPF